MEQFVVSARKYRPQTFKDVVGQQAITNTLLNAIETNHLASALLFTGAWCGENYLRKDFGEKNQPAGL
jgi:replication-associated recombination protein RarA